MDCRSKTEWQGMYTCQSLCHSYPFLVIVHFSDFWTRVTGWHGMYTIQACCHSCFQVNYPLLLTESEKKSLTEWQCDRGCTHVSHSVTLVHFSPNHWIVIFLDKSDRVTGGIHILSLLSLLLTSKNRKNKQEWLTDWHLCNISIEP